MYETEHCESTGTRLARLRRAHNITQEGLAEVLGVSRQAVSKWESDLTYPETDKLLRLARLYGCTVDYLLTGRDRSEAESATEAEESPTPNDVDRARITWMRCPRYFEYKSRRTIGGLPLVHINIGRGRRATGVFAIGLMARGIVSLGLASVGVVSIGLASVGLISLGVFSLGLLLAIGSVAVGAIALGAIAVGLLAIGALSVGVVSVGALAVGACLSVGDFAHGSITVGKTLSSGNLYAYTGTLPIPAAERSAMEALLAEHCPAVLRSIASLILRVAR